MTVYIAAIFLSAFLLFSIQPILGKFLLPWLGGSPAVWITAMMVYQGLLLCGYAFAHLLRSAFGERMSVGVHVALVVASLITLPLVPVTLVWADPITQPALWLVLSVIATVGLHFFLLAANTPLIQSWFAASGHPHAANPYFLYSASNLGSFLALISYPVLMERLLGTAGQLTFWSWSYGFFGVLIVVIGISLLRQRNLEIPASGTPAGPGNRGEGEPAPPPTIGTRLYWIALAFVPSSLLLGVTHYLTTDIAAFPLLWVIPLALYLLTFVVAFSRFNMPLLKNTLDLQIIFLFAAILTLALGLANIKVLIFHLVAFTVIAYVCHGLLSASRPHPRYLTGFYLWIAVGGVLGGIFNALAAPLLFTEIWEYPAALLAAALLRPASPADIGRVARIAWPGWREIAHALALGVLAFGIYWLATLYGEEAAQFDDAVAVAFVLVLGLMMVFARRRPNRLFAMMAAPLLCAGIFRDDGQLLFKERNFFGTLKVYHETESNIHKLLHGTTVHGLQSMDPEFRLMATSYYLPLEDIFPLARERTETAPVAVVGLGAGNLACLGIPGQQFDIFEINPAVVNVAQNRALFTYLSDCPPKDRLSIIMGDARLSIANAPDEKYGLIVLDAYNSDALPIHLLTREALSLYLKKLRPRGILAVHISNRYFNLSPVVQALAQDLGLTSVLGLHDGDDYLHYPSAWILLSRSSEAGDLMPRLPELWKPLPETDAPVWTDDYSDIIGSLK